VPRAKHSLFLPLTLAALLALPFLTGGVSAASIDASSAQQASQAPSTPEDTAKPARSAEQGQALEEIVVSARKVTESLQNAPLSVSALDEKTLENTGVLNLQDLGRVVPSLSVNSVGPGQNQLILRGVSSSGGQATVGYYLDDTPISGSGSTNLYETNSTDPSLFDLTRIEVLRGPQGTLYGASSMGGTVKYVTNQPDLSEFHTAVRTTFSETDGGGPNEEVDALLNQPIVDGSSGLRAIAYFRDYDGYIDRYPTNPDSYLTILPGPVDRDANTEKTWGTRLLLIVKPTVFLSITPTIWYQRMDLGAPFTFDKPPGSLDNPIANRLAQEPFSDETVLSSVTATANLNAVQITSAASYFDRGTTFTEDDSKVAYYFLSPAPQSHVYPMPMYLHYATHTFTEELRASGSVGALHGVLGAFYSRLVGSAVTNWPIPAGYNQAFGSPFGTQSLFTNNQPEVDTQAALFTDLSYALTTKLEVTAGIRLFHEQQSLSQQAAGVFEGGTFAGNVTESARGTTPKFDFDYHVTEDLLAYASATKGFREGGGILGVPFNLCQKDLANIGLNAAPTEYAPDTLWSYELGLKSEWLDHHLRVNADIYDIDWKNVQQLVYLPTCGAVFTANFGAARSKGSELEVTYEPTGILTLTVGSAFNQAQLTETHAGAQGEPGQELENAPRWQGSASSEIHHNIAADTKGFLRFGFSAVSHQYNNFDSASIYYREPGYSIANSRIGVTRDRFQLTLYCTNLFDKHAETALPLSYANNLPTTRAVSLNRPRTIGIDLRFDY
jgi:iron complex outermembrane receptor protein